MNEPVVEAEVVEPGTELTSAAPEQEVANLFHTTDPGEVLKRAMSTANALMPVVREQGLVVDIQGKDHLTVEAWQTLGAMLGVTPVCTWTRKLQNGWEARVEARTLDGRVIGAAEAECLTAESHWADADDYAVRSMAQTRATSKSLASVLRFVATLGGAAGTPAEEMDSKRNGGRTATEPQKKFAYDLLKRAGLAEAEKKAVHVWSHNADGELMGTKASRIIELLKTEKRNDPIDQTAVATLVGEAGYSESEVPADTEGLPDV